MTAHPSPPPIALIAVATVLAIHLFPLALLLAWAGEDGGELFFLAGVSLPLLGAILAAQLLVLAPWRVAAGLVLPRTGSLIWTAPPIAAAAALFVVGVEGAPAPAPQLLLIFAGIVGAAAAEEITFRGAVFAALAARPLLAVVGSAAVFGAAHLISIAGGATIAEAGSQAVGAFGFGLVVGAVRLKTGSLVGPILIHIAWNVAVLSADLKPGFLAEPAAAALAVAALVLAILALRARRRIAVGV